MRELAGVAICLVATARLTAQTPLQTLPVQPGGQTVTAFVMESSGRVFRPSNDAHGEPFLGYQAEAANAMVSRMIFEVSQRPIKMVTEQLQASLHVGSSLTRGSITP
jgi:hypothetical protein